ncbi:hypothetical protein WJX73_010790 [Symbiochloris irregularis]|uniref:Uncharacterized protein n=1 Tax=Symbiochloris irregularis TaxID=706552 RepID=A0AAW1NQU5_9CHLO
MIQPAKQEAYGPDFGVSFYTHVPASAARPLKVGFNNMTSQAATGNLREETKPLWCVRTARKLWIDHGRPTNPAVVEDHEKEQWDKFSTALMRLLIDQGVYESTKEPTIAGCFKAYKWLFRLVTNDLVYHAMEALLCEQQDGQAASGWKLGLERDNLKNLFAGRAFAGERLQNCLQALQSFLLDKCDSFVPLPSSSCIARSFPAEPGPDEDQLLVGMASKQEIWLQLQEAQQSEAMKLQLLQLTGVESLAQSAMHDQLMADIYKGRRGARATVPARQDLSPELQHYKEHELGFHSISRAQLVSKTVAIFKAMQGLHMAMYALSPAVTRFFAEVEANSQKSGVSLKGSTSPAMQSLQACIREDYINCDMQPSLWLWQSTDPGVLQRHFKGLTELYTRTKIAFTPADQDWFQLAAHMHQHLLEDNARGANWPRFVKSLQENVDKFIGAATLLGGVITTSATWKTREVAIPQLRHSDAWANAVGRPLASDPAMRGMAGSAFRTLLLVDRPCTLASEQLSFDSALKLKYFEVLGNILALLQQGSLHAELIQACKGLPTAPGIVIVDPPLAELPPTT